MKQAEIIHKEQPAELTCPISKTGQKSFKTWAKRFGWIGFFFFLIKGIIWLAVLFAAKGILD
jgi:hypothetical protein